MSKAYSSTELEGAAALAILCTAIVQMQSLRQATRSQVQKHAFRYKVSPKNMQGLHACSNVHCIVRCKPYALCQGEPEQQPNAPHILSSCIHSLYAVRAKVTCHNLRAGVCQIVLHVPWGATKQPCSNLQVLPPADKGCHTAPF